MPGTWVTVPVLVVLSPQWIVAVQSPAALGRYVLLSPSTQCPTVTVPLELPSMVLNVAVTAPPVESLPVPPVHPVKVLPVLPV